MNIKKKPRYLYHWGLSKWFLVVHVVESLCFESRDHRTEWCVLYNYPSKHCMGVTQCHKRIFKEIPNA